MWEPWFVMLVIGMAFVAFVSGRLRYDVVGLSAMTVLALAGVLPMNQIFHGFANDAVLSVIAVMIVGRAVRAAGATEPFAARMLGVGGGTRGQVLALTGTVGFFSAFMNNTGALAVFLPVAVHMARKMRRLASALLMPLAFATLLGGLVTLIGTPPNILVSNFRAERLGEPYALFDFSPVGLGIAVAGILFLAVVGWRLLPSRRGSVSQHQLLRMDHYFAEVRVPEDSPLKGGTLRDLEELHLDVNVVGLMRGQRHIAAPMSSEIVQTDDLLVVEAGGDQLAELLKRAGLELRDGGRGVDERPISSAEILVEEIVIGRGSPLVGRTARELRMRWRFGVNLLGISRRGERIVRRLPDVRLRAGDVLVIQVPADALEDVLQEWKCFTLVDHEHPLPSLGKLLLTITIFGSALGLVAFQILPLGLTFLSAALLLVMVRVVSVGQAYAAVDWPVVVLLGSTICLGFALETSGGAAMLAGVIVSLSRDLSAPVIMATIMICTMLISNLVNNAATAVLMAPIAYAVSLDLGASPDPFLMAVAVGASSCFLTPIGHQCNTLVLGPGGYRFSDYARMGAPLSAIVIIVGVILIPLFWPFH